MYLKDKSVHYDNHKQYRINVTYRKRIMRSREIDNRQLLLC